EIVRGVDKHRRAVRARDAPDILSRFEHDIVHPRPWNPHRAGSKARTDRSTSEWNFGSTQNARRYATFTPRTSGQSGSLCWRTHVSFMAASCHSRQAGVAITASM